MNYPGSPLQLGDTGEAVRAVQRRLSVQETGLIGPTTLGAIKAFQAAHGLTTDGVVGPMTWAALFPAQDAFTVALAFALRWEGGYTNHPADKGGETNRGITWRTYNRYRIDRQLPVRSVRHLEEHELQEIYRDDYWQPIGGDTLPLPVAVAAFDLSVNSGPGKAREYLRRTESLRNPLARALAINSLRREFFRDIAAGNLSQRVFLDGWLNRVDALDTEVKRLG